MIVPMHPFQSGHLHGRTTFPRPQMMDHFHFVEPVDGLPGHCRSCPRRFRQRQQCPHQPVVPYATDKPGTYLPGGLFVSEGAPASNTRQRKKLPVLTCSRRQNSATHSPLAACRQTTSLSPSHCLPYASCPFPLPCLAPRSESVSVSPPPARPGKILRSVSGYFRIANAQILRMLRYCEPRPEW